MFRKQMKIFNGQLLKFVFLEYRRIRGESAAPEVAEVVVNNKKKKKKTKANVIHYKGNKLNNWMK